MKNRQQLLSTLLIEFQKDCYGNTDEEQKMIDELHLLLLISRCKNLENKFAHVHAGDNFPLLLEENNFIIVNSDRADSEGAHWFVLCNKHGDFSFADPLGLPAHYYNYIYHQLSLVDWAIRDCWSTTAGTNQKNCGLYFVYIAHYVFSSYFPSIPFIHQSELMRFLKRF